VLWCGHDRVDQHVRWWVGVFVMVHGGGDADGDRGSGRAHNPNCNREYEAVATICGVCGWVATKGCRLWAGDRTAMIVDDRSESDTHLSESGPRN
jgi:hypothetical protein